MSSLKNTKCLSVTFHMPGDNRKGTLADVDVDADKSELRLSKRIFRSDSYRAAQVISHKTRRWLDKRSVPSPLKSGTYLVPEALMEEVEEHLREKRAEFLAEADAFITEYPYLVEKAKERLRGQFNPANYPPVEVIRRRFWMDRIFLDFTPAGDVEQQEELQQAMDDIRAALRCGLLELVTKLGGMLGERKNGQKRGVTKKTLSVFNEWLDLFPKRLVVDDDELKSLADKAKAVMEGKSQADLRDIGAVREQTRKELQQVGEQIEGLLKDMPSRAFSFDE